MPRGLAVLASGSGTILESIVGAALPVGLVVVDRPCRALDVAAAAGLDGRLVARDRFDADFDRAAYTARVVELLVAEASRSWPWPAS